jgi:hypothetical protein
VLGVQKSRDAQAWFTILPELDPKTGGPVVRSRADLPPEALIDPWTVAATGRLRYLGLLSSNVSIEVDKHTVDVLGMRAGEPSVTVSQLLAEFAPRSIRDASPRPSIAGRVAPELISRAEVLRRPPSLDGHLPPATSTATWCCRFPAVGSCAISKRSLRRSHAPRLLIRELR